MNYPPQKKREEAFAPALNLLLSRYSLQLIYLALNLFQEIVEIVMGVIPPMSKVETNPTLFTESYLMIQERLSDALRRLLVERVILSDKEIPAPPPTLTKTFVGVIAPSNSRKRKSSASNLSRLLSRCFEFHSELHGEVTIPRTTLGASLFL